MDPERQSSADASAGGCGSLTLSCSRPVAKVATIIATPPICPPYEKLLAAVQWLKRAFAKRAT